MVLDQETVKRLEQVRGALSGLSVAITLHRKGKRDETTGEPYKVDLFKLEQSLDRQQRVLLDIIKENRESENSEVLLTRLTGQLRHEILHWRPKDDGGGTLKVDAPCGYYRITPDFAVVGFSEEGKGVNYPANEFPHPSNVRTSRDVLETCLASLSHSSVEGMPIIDLTFYEPPHGHFVEAVFSTGFLYFSLRVQEIS